MAYQSRLSPRILVVDRDEYQRACTAAAAATITVSARVRAVSSLERAVEALDREEFELILMASDLGRGTSAFTSAVTLMGAGTAAVIAVYVETPAHAEGMALESIGIYGYLRSRELTPDTLRGLLVSDHQDLQPEFVREVGGWLRDGRLRYRETVVSGIENNLEAFMGVLRGDNTGKMIVALPE